MPDQEAETTAPAKLRAKERRLMPMSGRQARWEARVIETDEIHPHQVQVEDSAALTDWTPETPEVKK